MQCVPVCAGTSSVIKYSAVPFSLKYSSVFFSNDARIVYFPVGFSSSTGFSSAADALSDVTVKSSIRQLAMPSAFLAVIAICGLEVMVMYFVYIFPERFTHLPAELFSPSLYFFSPWAVFKNSQSSNVVFSSFSGFTHTEIFEVASRFTSVSVILGAPVSSEYPESLTDFFSVLASSAVYSALPLFCSKTIFSSSNDVL